MHYLLLLLSFVLSGCVYGVNLNTGNQNLNSYLVEQTIVKGKTTKQELLQKLGPPQNVSKPANFIPRVEPTGVKVELPPAITAKETWNYWSRTHISETKAGSIILATSAQTNATYKMFMLTIYMDENGVVQDYSTTESYQ